VAHSAAANQMHTAAAERSAGTCQQQHEPVVSAENDVWTGQAEVPAELGRR